MFPPRPRSKRPPSEGPTLFDALYDEADSGNTTAPKAVDSRHDTEKWAESGAAEHEAEIHLLIPIAQRLARGAGASGVTVTDVREEAVKRGLIPALGEGRSLSYLGALGKKAGLVATDRVRRSHIEGTHGNRQTVWVAPEFAERVA